MNSNATENGRRPQPVFGDSGFIDGQQVSSGAISVSSVAAAAKKKKKEDLGDLVAELLKKARDTETVQDMINCISECLKEDGDGNSIGDSVAELLNIGRDTKTVQDVIDVIREWLDVESRPRKRSKPSKPSLIESILKIWGGRMKLDEKLTLIQGGVRDYVRLTIPLECDILRTGYDVRVKTNAQITAITQQGMPVDFNEAFEGGVVTTDTFTEANAGKVCLTIGLPHRMKRRNTSVKPVSFDDMLEYIKKNFGREVYIYADAGGTKYEEKFKGENVRRFHIIFK